MGFTNVVSCMVCDVSEEEEQEEKKKKKKKKKRRREEEEGEEEYATGHTVKFVGS